MFQNRFFYPEKISPPCKFCLNKDLSHHIATVLKLKEGENISLFNGDGFFYTGIIAYAHKKNTEVDIKRKEKPNNESKLKIHLGQALAKGSRMDYSIQKAVELGVTTITPLITTRTIAKIHKDKIDTKLAHFEKIVQHACAQSCRCFVPKILAPENCNSWFSNKKNKLNLILSTRGGTSIKNLPIADEVIITVGPEGDFSEEEEQTAYKYNFTPISLGPRILRTETAGPAAIAALQLHMGDF